MYFNKSLTLEVSGLYKRYLLAGFELIELDGSSISIIYVGRGLRPIWKATGNPWRG